MAQWKVWEPAFNHVTFREDGDDNEQDASNQFDLDKSFSNCELFWQRHVVPATNRPANHAHRQFVDPDYQMMTQISHAIFCDLFEAEKMLKLVRAANYGGSRFQNCYQTLSHGGNALQKIEDLQSRTESMLKKLGTTIKIWTQAQWDSTWKPRYSVLSAYRNFYIHKGTPEVLMDNETPLVPHENHVSFYKKISWAEQSERYKIHPTEWDAFGNVCERVQKATIVFLNDIYAEFLKVLDRFLTSEDYQNLWGWDTKKYGSHAGRRPLLLGTSFYATGAGKHTTPPSVAARPFPGGSGMGFTGS